MIAILPMPRWNKVTKRQLFQDSSKLNPTFYKEHHIAWLWSIHYNTQVDLIITWWCKKYQDTEDVIGSYWWLQMEHLIKPCTDYWWENCQKLEDRTLQYYKFPAKQQQTELLGISSSHTHITTKKCSHFTPYLNKYKWKT